MEHKINFLDITIHREHNIFSIEIYRKPTFTDSIIPNDSCHPKEHKLAAIRYLYNRMKNYQLSPDKTQKVKKLIQKNLHKNDYNTPIRKTTSNNNKHEPNIEKTLWNKFTYSGREKGAITKFLEY
jgi:hypothetical protein